jgi:hypothetical protein
LYEETKTRLEIWVLRLDLLVKGAVCILIATLIFSPSTILSSLNSGDVKVSDVEIFGVKIKIDSEAGEQVDALRQRLADTLDEAGTLRLNAENLNALLGCSVSQSCTAQQQSEIASLVGLPVKRSVEGSALSDLQEAVVSAESSSEAWIIVVGADKTIESAEFERSKLTQAGFEGQIVRRGSWFRTIARFGDGASAQAAEQQIQAIMNRDVYVLPFSNWCKAPSSGDDGLVVCQT